MKRVDGFIYGGLLITACSLIVALYFNFVIGVLMISFGVIFLIAGIIQKFNTQVALSEWLKESF